MDGCGRSQLPLSSIDVSTLDEQNWPVGKKRRSRKPQETFRRQNTDIDDVMADLIEYDQMESLMTVSSDSGVNRSSAVEASTSAMDLYHRAVEMWHEQRGLDPIHGNHCADVQLNVGLSIPQKFCDFQSDGRLYAAAMQSDDSVEHVNAVNNHGLEVEDQEEAEDEYVDEDFNLCDDSQGPSGHESEQKEKKQMSPRQLSSLVTCDICQRTFKGRSQLASHLKTHRRPLHCEACSIRFTSQGTLLWHQRFVHAAQKYNHTCEVCGETVRLKQDLMSHYMTHRLSKGVVRCECGQAFRNTATLKLHEMNMCSKRETEKDGCCPVNDATGSMSPDGTMLATAGHKSFSENHANSAILAEDGFLCNERNCDQDGENSLADGGSLISYSCPFCSQTFHSKGLYTIHTKKHTKPHTCDICGRGFAKKFTMECHRKTHLSQKDYRCELCGQAFTLRPQLAKHKTENHEMERGLSCHYCDARFKHRNLLQRHEAHYCPNTGGRDAEPSEDAAARLDCEKEFPCPQCDKVLDTQWALDQHVKYHSRRFSCEICGHKYGERFLLQSHLLTHLGVRPYKCTVCGAAFTMKAHCERHCRMHLRVQHFECEACGYMFRYEHDRLTHMTGFCLGSRDEKSDISKMMSVDKPDFAQLGITSKMLGYSTPPVSTHSPSPPPVTMEPNSDEVVQAESEQLDSPMIDAKKGVEDELSRRKLLKCNICGKKLKKKAILTMHLAREHGIGEEPFKCFICGQGAPFEKAMRLHIESHLPYKLYRCSSCGVRFSNRRSLTTHELHEKCFSSRRTADCSSNAEHNGTTEIIFVNEDLSTLPLKTCDSEVDQDANTLPGITDESAVINDLAGNFQPESFSAIKIKDEIIDNGYEMDSFSSAEGDSDHTVCNTNDQNAGTLVSADGQEPESSSLQNTTSEIGRLVCVIKKEKNGTGYKIRKSVAEDSDLSVAEMLVNQTNDEEKRNQLLKLPMHVKVLRDGFGNERVFVNDELFPLWCDFAVQASRTSDNSCKDFKEWCDLCQRFIIGKYKCRVHMQRHSQVRPFSCSICNKAFKTTENLRTHMRWHDPSRLIVCAICGAKCVSPSDMKRHMTVHEGIKPYVCSTCGKGFRRKMYLNTHVRTHTGETPFSCNVCGRRFRIYSSLHDHQKLHSGHKPFECSICHKRFAQRANWRTHERRHKGVKNFECEVCQKGFVQNYELQNHRLRCVKQDLPYICLLCGMKFTKEHPLKRHINRHSCGICGKQFVIMKEKVSHQLRCRRKSKLPH